MANRKTLYFSLVVLLFAVATVEGQSVNIPNSDIISHLDIASLGSLSTNKRTSWHKVCQADPDNDGKSNGDELGDPCCEWKNGLIPRRSLGISNPLSHSSVTSYPSCVFQDPSPPPYIHIKAGVRNATITWGKTSDEESCICSYKILRCTLKGVCEDPIIVPYNQYEIIDNQLESDTTYNYRIYSRNLKIGATPVNIAAVTTLPDSNFKGLAKPNNELDPKFFTKVVLAPGGLFSIAYNLSSDNTSLTVKMISTATGYIGMGFNPGDGAMGGADYVVGFVTGGTSNCGHYYSQSTSGILVDSATGLVSCTGSIVNGGLTFTYTRLLNTGGANDKTITLTGANYLTWAVKNTNPESVSTLLTLEHDSANGATIDFSKNPTAASTSSTILQTGFLNIGVATPVHGAFMWTTYCVAFMIFVFFVYIFRVSEKVEFWTICAIVSILTIGFFTGIGSTITHFNTFHGGIGYITVVLTYIYLVVSAILYRRRQAELKNVKNLNDPILLPFWPFKAHKILTVVVVILALLVNIYSGLAAANSVALFYALHSIWIILILGIALSYYFNKFERFLPRRFDVPVVTSPEIAVSELTPEEKATKRSNIKSWYPQLQ